MSRGKGDMGCWGRATVLSGCVQAHEQHAGLCKCPYLSVHARAMVLMQGKKKKVGPSPAAMKLAAKTAAAGVMVAKRAPAASSASQQTTGTQMASETKSLDGVPVGCTNKSGPHQS